MINTLLLQPQSQAIAVKPINITGHIFNDFLNVFLQNEGMYFGLLLNTDKLEVFRGSFVEYAAVAFLRSILPNNPAFIN